METSLNTEIFQGTHFLQKCLPVASLEFKRFCVGIRYLAVPLQNGKNQSICDAARSLTGIIDGVARRESPVQKRATPLPTPPSSPDVSVHPSLARVQGHHPSKVSLSNGRSPQDTRYISSFASSL